LTPTKKSENKKGGGKGGKAGEKKDGRNSRNGDRNRGGRTDHKEKDSVTSGPPLKWGDKPSFANVLKSADEATNSDKKPQVQNTQRKQRSRSGSESSAGGKGGSKSQPSADDSTWSKQKLPPLNKEEP
jgi:hypothetical protein